MYDILCIPHATFCQYYGWVGLLFTIGPSLQLWDEADFFFIPRGACGFYYSAFGRVFNGFTPSGHSLRSRSPSRSPSLPWCCWVQLRCVGIKRGPALHLPTGCAGSRALKKRCEKQTLADMCAHIRPLSLCLLGGSGGGGGAHTHKDDHIFLLLRGRATISATEKSPLNVLFWSDS